MKDYTDITLLIDRSGSMQSCKEEMEKGISKYLEGLKPLPSTLVSVIQFDNESTDVLMMGVPITMVGKVSIQPRGGTPLYDAMKDTINMIGNRFREMDQSIRPTRVLFITITDGEENASVRTSSQDLAAMIRKQTTDFSWDFIYLGANQDAIMSGKHFGLARANTMTYTANAQGIGSTFDSLLSRTTAYSTGMSNTVSGFTELERSEAVGNAPTPPSPTY